MFNALMTAWLTYLSWSPMEFAPFYLVIINQITKYINTKYFGDLGVK